MTNGNSKNVTPADVAAKASEEKLVTTVPAQGEKPEVTVTTGNPQVDSPVLTVVEGGKKSLKERLAEVTVKLKEHQKIVVAVSVTVVAATVMVLKYAKQQAETALETDESVEVTVDDAEITGTD